MKSETRSRLINVQTTLAALRKKAESTPGAYYSAPELRCQLALIVESLDAVLDIEFTPAQKTVAKIHNLQVALQAKGRAMDPETMARILDDIAAAHEEWYRAEAGLWE